MLTGVVCLWGMTEDPTLWAGRLIRSPMFGFLRDLAEKLANTACAAWTVAFHSFLFSELYVAMVLVVLVGPGSSARTCAITALPLYFSRPVRRVDYFLGKLGVIGFFLGAVTVVPAIAAWVLGVLFSFDLTVIVDTARILLAMVIQGVIVTVSAGLFILALSSLTRNSRYVAVAFAGIWVVSGLVSHALENVQRSQIQRNAFVGDPRLQQINGELADINRKLGDFPGAGHAPPVVIKDPQEHARLLMRRDELVRQQFELAGTDWSSGEQEYEQSQRDDWRPLFSYTANLQCIGVVLWAAAPRGKGGRTARCADSGRLRQEPVRPTAAARAWRRA